MALTLSFATNGLITLSELPGVTGSSLLHHLTKTSSLSDTDTDPGHHVDHVTFVPNPVVVLGLLHTTVSTSTMVPGTATGTVTYDFSVMDKLLDQLSQGEVRTQNWDVTITDDDGELVTQRITVQATGANDKPAAHVDIRSINENVVRYTYGVLGNDIDVDHLDTKHVVSSSVVSVTSAGLSLLDKTMVKAVNVNFLSPASTMLPKDAIKVTLDKAFQGLATGENALVVVKYVMADNHGATSASEFRLTVVGQNDSQIIGTSAADKHLLGEKNADQIFGLGGADIITPRGGHDILRGGGGRDIFDFNVKADSGKGALADDIMDFVRGQDRIDLSSFAGTFKFRGVGPLVLGQSQVRIDDHGANVTVQIDTNGDRVVDMMIDVANVGILTKADFIL